MQEVGEFLKNLPFPYVVHKIQTTDGKITNFKFVDANLKFKKIINLDKKDLMGKKTTEIPNDIKRINLNWSSIYSEVMTKNKTIKLEKVTKNSKKKYRIEAYSPKKNYFITIFVDITGKTEIDNIEEKNKKLLENLSEQVPGVIYQYRIYPDGRGCFPFSSGNIKDIYGVSPEEVIEDHKKVLDRLHPEDYNHVIESIMESKKTLNKWEDEYRVILPKKGIIWVKGQAQPELLEDGSVLWHGYIFNVTDRKLQQFKTEELKNQFELAVKGTNDGIWDWNIKTNELFLSKRWKEMLGYEDSQIKNTFDSFISLVYEDDLSKVNDYIQRYLNGEIEKYSIEFRMKHKDGSIHWILAKGEALRDKNGVPYRMAGSHSDITKRKKIEADFKKNKERLELAIEAGEYGFWDWNIKTNDTYFSPTYYSMLGYKNKELPMNLNTFKQLLHPDDTNKVMSNIQKSIEARKSYEVEFRLKCKDGSYKWIMGKGKTYFNNELGVSKRVVGVHIDINDRKIVKERLRESKLRLKVAIEGTEAGIWDWNMIKNTVTFSKQWKNMLGYKKGEIEDSFESWKKLWHPDDVEKIEKTINDHLAGKTERYEVVNRLKHKDGSWHWIMTRGKLLRDDKNEPYRWVGTNIDVTKQKEVESKLRESEKN
ncbi:MAG: PAS domain-containing protein, partial [Fusobacteriota bacterium]